jgi:hypothetical protein
MRSVAGLLRVLLMGSAVVLTACASFPQHMVPTVTAMPDMGPPAQRPVAHMDVSFFAGEPGNNPTPLNEGQPGIKELQLLVHKTVNESGLFQQVLYDGATAQPATDPNGLHVSLRVFDHCSATGAMIASLVTGFTLGLVPGGTTDNFTLQLEVTNSRGQTLARVSNDDATRTWVGLAFLPVSGHELRQSTHAMLANQIRAALKQAYDAGKLVAVNAPPATDGSSVMPAVAGVK